MPLDDAILLIGRSFLQYVEGLREKAGAAVTPLPAAPSRFFLPASPEVAYLLNLLADNRALTVPELNSVLKYLQERRDKLIDAESRPIITEGEDGIIKQSPPQQQPDKLQSPFREPVITSPDAVKDPAPTQDLARKILSMFSSAGGSIQGVPPANGTQPPKPPTGTPAPPPPAPVASSASLINFDNPNVQKALDNLIQSSPSLLKNINTKTSLSSGPLGASSISSSLSALGFGQGGGGLNAGQMQASQSPSHMQGGIQGMGYGSRQAGPGGMQGQRAGMGQSGMQGSYNMPGQSMQEQMGGYGSGQPR